MTGFIAAAQATIINAADDRSAMDEYWHYNEDLYFSALHVQPNDDDRFGIWSTPWWPTGSSIGSGWDGLSEGALMAQAGWWEAPWVVSGANGRLAFVGYTRDATNSPVGNCTVRCFRTSTDEMVSKVVSDANGFYIASSPYSDAHFIVVHDAAGNRGGASVTTILPA